MQIPEGKINIDPEEKYQVLISGRYSGVKEYLKKRILEEAKRKGIQTIEVRKEGKTHGK